MLNMLSVVSSNIVSCKGAFSCKDRRAVLLMWKAVLFDFPYAPCHLN